MTERKIIKYSIVTVDLNDARNAVQQFIDDGWQPFNVLVPESNGDYLQAIVKYEE